MTESVFQVVPLLFTILLPSTLRRHNERRLCPSNRRGGVCRLRVGWSRRKCRSWGDFAPAPIEACRAPRVAEGSSGTTFRSGSSWGDCSDRTRRAISTSEDASPIFWRNVVSASRPAGVPKRTVPTASLLPPNVTEYSVVVRSIVGPAARSMWSRVGGRAATFSCDGRMLADDCIPPDTSIRNFARSTESAIRSRVAPLSARTRSRP